MRLAMLMVVLGAWLSASMTYAQSSTAPPSSLLAAPLGPPTDDARGTASCDLCRPLEGRPGSDLKRHRRPQDRELHPHQKAPGVSKSLKRSLGSQLPRHKLQEIQEGSER
jgi:hypothetical protein